MELTGEQNHAIEEILKFKRDTVTLGGYAGTGKTTIISHLAEILPTFAVCAYTGKAANVLRKKGISDASTIHSLIYTPYQDIHGNVYFSLAEFLDCEGIIVDEASMVSKDIYDDLLYFNKPVIFVGDHGQLEPIGDKFNVMEKPDHVLKTIHRNAGEIAHFAEFIRNGYRPAAWELRSSGKRVIFIGSRHYKKAIHEVDQVICAFNKTRVEINIAARKQLGRQGVQPVVDDRIMCLRNDSMVGLFNGMQGVVKSIEDNRLAFAANDSVFYDLVYDPGIFHQAKPDFDYDGPHPFDFCWGITCHKAQGDEWPRGLVVEQKCDLWEHPRWAYTAASRFKEGIVWVT
jgi:exodeoxyribonuclease-5